MHISKIVMLLLSLMGYELFAKYPESFVEDNKIVCELPTQEYVDIIRPFLPSNPTILEAGAHGGQDTVILAQSWPTGIVYAFEPVEKFVGFIKNELVKHEVMNACLFPFALSKTSGEQTFYYSNTIGAASSLLPSNNLCDYQDTKMTVQCVNLDEWAQKNNVNHIDFMWLDMEGSELLVLRSAPMILKTVRVIITEVNFLEFRQGGTLYNDLYSFLKSAGFTLFKIWGDPARQGTALFIRSATLLK